MKLKVLLLILAACVIAACKTATAPLSCPHCSQPMGARPPAGDETWCQKMVDGQPVKDGPFALYRSGGTLMLEGSYHDGKQDGEHIGWYTNGKISAMGMYKNGKREGVWKRWDAQGFKNWEEVYKDDKRIS